MIHHLLLNLFSSSLVELELVGQMQLHHELNFTVIIFMDHLYSDLKAYFDVMN